MGTHGKGRSGARALALQALYCMAMYPEGEERVSEFGWLAEEDREDRTEKGIQFALLLVSGVRAHILELDAAIRAHTLHWDFTRLLEVDKAILRLSAYALLYLTDIPVAVTINEAIELAKKYSDVHSSQFVNGVLDAIGKDAPHGRGGDGAHGRNDDVPHARSDDTPQTPSGNVPQTPNEDALQTPSEDALQTRREDTPQPRRDDMPHAPSEDTPQPRRDADERPEVPFIQSLKMA